MCGSFSYNSLVNNLGTKNIDSHNINREPVDKDGKIREDKKKCEFCERENFVLWNRLCPNNSKQDGY